MTDYALLQRTIETGGVLPLSVAMEWAQNFGPLPKQDSDKESMELDKAIQLEEYFTGNPLSQQQPTLEKPTRLETVWAHIGCGVADSFESYTGVKTVFQINAGLIGDDEKTNDVLGMLEDVFKNRRIEGFRDNTSSPAQNQKAVQPLSKLEQLEAKMRQKNNNNETPHL